MESEERPAKMRKLDRDAEMPDAAPMEMQIPVENHLEKPANDESTPAASDLATAPKMSKNQLKKQMRADKWEAGREDRKVKRRDKNKEKKQHAREEWEKHAKEAADAGDKTPITKPRGKPSVNLEGARVPITVIIDCGFEDLMYDNEMKSLGLQVTRCYSDNRKAKYQAHLAVSSFGGKMKERFDGLLEKQYVNWKGMQFLPEDFVEVAEKSKQWMAGDDGGKVAGAIAEGAGPGQEEEEGEVVYLSSESDVTLDRLKPNSTYIIGGLVDKNRYKGLCHKRAVERGIKTAKLPIGEFLHMKSRQVLVTNHVLEIMLKWMECGDWGEAFMAVLPKRKGGVLKSELEGGEGDEGTASEANGDAVKGDNDANEGVSIHDAEQKGANETAIPAGADDAPDSVAQ